MDQSEWRQFVAGAQNRRMGISKSQSAKAVKHMIDLRKANNYGWDEMHRYLLLQKIDSTVLTAEHEAAHEGAKAALTEW